MRWVVPRSRALVEGRDAVPQEISSSAVAIAGVSLWMLLSRGWGRFMPARIVPYKRGPCTGPAALGGLFHRHGE